MVTDEADGRFVCDHPGCSRSYLRKEHLKRHILSHQKGRFVCHLCQRMFTRKSGPPMEHSLWMQELIRFVSDLLNAHLQRHQGQFHSAGNSHANTVQDKRARINSIGHAYSDTESWTAETNYSSNAQSQFDATDMELTSPPPTLIANGLLTSGPGLGEGSELSPEPWLFGGMGLFSYRPEDFEIFCRAYDTDHNAESTSPWSDNVPSAQLDFSYADAQRVWDLIPDRGALNSIASLRNALESFLSYCDLLLPIFHRPSFVISETPALLLLTMCHAGTQIRVTPDVQHVNWSRDLHQQLSQMAMKAALSNTNFELSLLQTLVVIQHVGMYCLSGSEHEMAVIMHNLAVTMARQSNHMGEPHSFPGGKDASDSHTRWKEWAQREATVRLAHAMFIADVQHQVHFSQHMILSVTMMKRPLPCSATLWLAPTAHDWEARMKEGKHLRQNHRHSLHTLMKYLLSSQDSEFKRSTWYRFEALNPLSCYLAIHGLIAAIAECKYRVVESRSSLANNTLKNLDFANGLRLWRLSFERIPPAQRNSPLVRSAKLMYHFAAILLRNHISDPQLAAGSAFAFGRAVTAQRSQDAFDRLTSTDKLCQESYLHGLAIVQLGLQLHQEPCEGGAQDIQDEGRDSAVLSMPVWQAHSAFLGVLIVWARVVSLEAVSSGGVQEEMESLDCDLLLDGTDISIDGLGTGPGIGRFPSSQMPSSILRRELSRDDHGLALDTAKGNLHILLGLVQNCLRGDSSYVASEARRILQGISQSR